MYIAYMVQMCTIKNEIKVNLNLRNYVKGFSRGLQIRFARVYLLFIYFFNFILFLNFTKLY